LLLRGVVLADKKSQSPNPDKSLVSEAAWDIINELENSKESALAQLRPLISENLELFRTWATTAEPHVEPLPCGLEDSLSRFQKLIVLKCFREEKLVFALQNFVRDQLGKTYISPPPFNLESVFKDTSFKTPIIFILSTGADPTSVFLRFAKQMNYDDRLHVISLGQGQGPVAARLIEQAVKTGDWVLLQNCHLAVSWMTALEKIVLGFGEAADGQINPDFRLWLTSMPSEKFPVSVLQNGVKLTNEPPKGLRANLIGSYAGFTEEEFNDSIVDPNKRAAWRSLLFGLSFFHASIQERRKFGPLGWNIRYEFNQSDLDVSIRVLRNFLNEYDEVLWKALLYVTGEINYGGRVTDDWDRRCLNTTLRAFYRTQVMEPNYRFSSSDAYRTPEATSLQDYRDFIEELPFADDPAIFGMHQNANISFQNQETQQILQTVLSIQPRASGAGAGASPEEIVSNLAASILLNLPAVLTMEEAGSSTFVEGPSGAPDSLSTVLSQEMERFNRLLVRIRSSLVDLQKAIKGIVVMSQQLDAMYSSMLNNMVPALWAQLAYPSLKPFGLWVKDLH
jgi:dynein heavy chain